MPAASTPPSLENEDPIDINRQQHAPYKKMFEKLQGNIVKGHGRDYSANIFINFSATGSKLGQQIAALAKKYIRSTLNQLEESERYKRFKVPGTLFGNLFLTVEAYRRLGIADATLQSWFHDKIENPSDPRFPQKSTFLNGMTAAAEDFGDNVEDVEPGYRDQPIHVLLLLADDDEGYLMREVNKVVVQLEEMNAQICAIELGKALRNEDGEGIEHFGYVDGRSQPLFLASDFKGLDKSGKIDFKNTTEKVNDKAKLREAAEIDLWDPFAKLDLVLLKDQAVEDPFAFGSYFVFRKLEQNVLGFSIAEEKLADDLNLEGSDRERAGAMAVGRFRDGTPLVLSQVDGVVPTKSNNFRFDSLDSELKANNPAPDELGLKCPFHAHIRKTNPRQSTEIPVVGVPAPAPDPAAVLDQEKRDRKRRIARRGIPYGDRPQHPSSRFQPLADLPKGGVGLLFACFQRSIIEQFAFMQKTWVNNVGFKKPLTGIDPLIGQPLTEPHTGGQPPNPPHFWRDKYGAKEPLKPDEVTHATEFNLSGFIKFRGGDFFFAPSLPFLFGLGKQPTKKAKL